MGLRLHPFPSTPYPGLGSGGSAGNLQGLWAELDLTYFPLHITWGWDQARGKEVGEEEKGQESSEWSTLPAPELESKRAGRRGPRAFFIPQHSALVSACL